MANTFEPAATGRSKCRGCGIALAKGELRFGERVPNAFGEGEATQWFHPLCAAYKRPEAMIAGLETAPPDLPDRATLERVANASLAHTRLQRIDGAERSPTSQAKCRHCKEPIEKGTWRIRLVFYEEGMFAPGGYIHIACRGPYFESADLVGPVLHFSPSLSETDRKELRTALEAS